MKPETEPLESYFAIAGIHGQPLKPWDTTKDKNRWYCAHGTSLFGTWHWPYVALYEQRLYEIMRALIKDTFVEEDHAAMYKAAETWRLPYWDWAVKKPEWDFENPDSLENTGPPVDLNVPYLLTQKTVYVKGKTGEAEPMPNPMWSYALPDQAKNFGSYGITNVEGKYPSCKVTSRRPRVNGDNPKGPLYQKDWVNGETQNWSEIASQLRSAKDRPTGEGKTWGNTLPEAVYRLFTETEKKAPTYPQFGSSSWESAADPRTYYSLENVHGNVHGFIGGYGFMSSPSVAAFDPIFWMHHCNIDRLVAMWQDLYPEKYNSWLTTPIRNPTFANPQPDTKLSPFHSDANATLYDSAACSKPKSQLGYTYPELQTWLPKYKTNGVFDEQKYRKALKDGIDIMYSTTGKMTLLLQENQELAMNHLSNMTPANIAQENFPAPLAEKYEEVKAEHPQPIQPLSQESWTTNDYVFNVVYDRFAVDGYPYSIRVFLGDVPQQDSMLFADTPTQLGMVYNFSSPKEARGMGPEGCEYCEKQQADHALSAGQVILTDYLVENITKSIALRGITLRSLDPADVIPYLRENLHWRVMDFFDNEIPRSDPRLSDLKISVAMGKATHFGPASHLSSYEDYQVLWDITENRPAGAAPGDLGL